ncbi:MAG: hypothetical protein ABGX07_22335 [Pirellulaceae bacterium]
MLARDRSVVKGNSDRTEIPQFTGPPVVFKSLVTDTCGESDLLGGRSTG